MDIGHHIMSFGLVVSGTVREETIRLAHMLNVPQVSLPYFPYGPSDGKSGDKRSLISVTPETVLVTAVKRSEDGKALIARVHETAGRRTSVKIDINDADLVIETSFGPFEIRTWRLEPTDSGFIATEVNLMEEPV